MWRISVSLLLIGLPAAAAPGTPAMTEDAVIWYTAINTPAAEPIRQRFEHQHPGVKLTILRQPGEKIRNRILSEAHAGKHLWDVVSFNHLDMNVLDREGLLAAYASPQAPSGFPPG